MLSSITKKGEIESAFAPLVVLVIHNNIYLIELINIQVKDFRMFNDWHGKDKECGPFKMLRTYIGKSSRLFIFGLVIQDHIESIGKPILLKGDEVLIMIYLLKCSMILLQNPQPLSLSKLVPFHKSQLGSTESHSSGPTEFIWTVPPDKP